MTTLHLIGRIKADGQLELELPPGLPEGEIAVILELPNAEPVEAETWTDEELAELLKEIKPMSGAEAIAAGLVGGWKDRGITDSVAWLNAQREKRRLKNQW